jgi:FtsH-binding integral membrane protein
VRDRRHQRGLFACLWLSAAVALILLLAVSSATHHQAPYLWFVLVPVFLFSVVVVRERMVPETDPVWFSQPPRLSLFQRPPPSLI